MPNSLPRLIRSRTSAFFSKALLGIQPRFRQAPPTLSFSIRATFIPNWAARMAATYPPGPAPTTQRSNSSLVVAIQILLALLATLKPVLVIVQLRIVYLDLHLVSRDSL